MSSSKAPLLLRVQIIESVLRLRYRRKEELDKLNEFL